MTFKHAGTVSHGTLRTEDLLVAFLPVLQDIDPNTYRLVISGDEPLDEQVVACLSIDGSTELPDHLQEAAVELLDWIADHLNDVAPEGYRFGATEGDGSDFGFWKINDDGEV